MNLRTNSLSDDKCWDGGKHYSNNWSDRKPEVSWCWSLEWCGWSYNWVVDLDGYYWSYNWDSNFSWSENWGQDI